MLSLWLGLTAMLTVASLFIWQPFVFGRVANPLLSKQAALILIFLLVAPTLFIYKINGASQQIQERITLEKFQAQFGDLQGLITAMEKRLAQQPNSAKGWYLLGKLYMHAAQYSSAVTALAKANSLAPGQPEILLNYKEAQRLAQSPKQ